jgi:hypothetical protein
LGGCQGVGAANGGDGQRAVGDAERHEYKKWVLGQTAEWGRRFGTGGGDAVRRRDGSLCMRVDGMAKGSGQFSDGERETSV